MLLGTGRGALPSAASSSASPALPSSLRRNPASRRCLLPTAAAGPTPPSSSSQGGRGFASPGNNNGNNNGNNDNNNYQTTKTARVKAVAAKISAARELARRLAEEKAMAAAAARGEAEEEAKHDAEQAAVLAAAQAARADAAARAAGAAASSSSSSSASAASKEQIARLRSENEALKALLLELAADRRAAQDRLSQLQERMTAAVEAAVAGGAVPVAVLAEPAAVAAPPAAATAPPPAPAPKQPSTTSGPSSDDLVRLARAAASSGLPTFAWPADLSGRAATDPAAPVPVGSPDARIFYNRLSGPLPATSSPSMGALSLKIGFNRWETIVSVPMQPCAALAGLSAAAAAAGGSSDGAANAPPQEWWEARLGPLAEDLFAANFVVTEPASGQTDNNRSRDFALPLIGGPTEQELAERRAAEYERAEAERQRLLEEAEEALWRAVEKEAESAAKNAASSFRARRSEELKLQAEALADERLQPPAPPAPAVDLSAAPERVEGVYCWVALSGAGGRPVAPGNSNSGASTLRAGARAFFAYNARHGPLAGAAASGAGSLLLHLGHDGWQRGAEGTTAHELLPLSAERAAELGLVSGGGDANNAQSWYGAEISALPGDPLDARVLDFVLSDRERRAWDNAGGKDFHTALLVPPPPAFKPPPRAQVFEAALRELTEASKVADLAAEERLSSAARARVEDRARVLRRRREAQRQFLYTVPVQPRAGGAVDVFYNPDLTPLRGRPEIFLRAGFNRWRQSNGSAVRMTPAMPGGVGFQKARLEKVPEDAHVLDAVFSDAGDDGASGGGSGFFDNNGGLDYHIPVVGADPAKHPPPALSVVHIAVEMAPIAKVGGMGDVVTALARAVQEEGHAVEVVLPKYDVIDYGQVKSLVQEGSFGWNNTQVRVWKGEVEGLKTTFLEPESGQFWVGCIYGRNDDAARFAFFCGAALEYLKQRGVKADILHCHDWQSAPAVYGDKPPNARTIFTIHNLNYGADLIGRAMGACDAATTVSPTYASEISGHPAIAPHLGKMFGVRNGIDQDIWDPHTDPFLPRHYGRADLVEGKAAAKKALRERMGLSDVDVPVVGVVTRLVHQKGIHLIKHAAWRSLERGAQFVLLGSAPDPKVQAEFNQLKEQLSRQYPERACLRFAYDEPLSHLIYAGSDMFLVPSMFEPCGLTQMIAMRYGKSLFLLLLLRGAG
jgi:starch synthase